MIKLNIENSTLFSEVTESMLPFTTKTNDAIFIYIIDDKLKYNCLEISENGKWLESFSYDSFDEMMSDAIGSSLNKTEVLCDLEINVK